MSLLDNWDDYFSKIWSFHHQSYNVEYVTKFSLSLCF
jgi:hypothetical protein